jgi:hypothetical protein
MRTFTVRKNGAKNELEVDGEHYDLSGMTPLQQHTARQLLVNAFCRLIGEEPIYEV